MTVQPMLFDALPAYQRSSATSREAAERIAPDAATIRAHVLAFITSRGRTGATYKEIMTALRICSGTACARINELKGGKNGAHPRLIKESGRRDRCAVLVANPFFAVAGASAPHGEPATPEAV